MVRTISHSGCEHDLLEQLHNIGIHDCQNLSDIDHLKKTYASQLEGLRTEKKSNANSVIQILNQQREEIRNTYTQGFDKIVGWFKRISPSLQIFSQRNQLRRELNRLDAQESQLNYYYQRNKHTIIGARGEIKVIQELQKLPDEYILINDYKIEFGKYVHWRKYDEYVGSAQIDHLLLSPYGIFILETKNWSQQTFDQKIHTRHSPIWQLDRHNFALWYYLRNSRFSRVRKFNILVLMRPLRIPQRYINHSYIVPISQLVDLIRSKREQVIDENRVERLLRYL